MHAEPSNTSDINFENFTSDLFIGGEWRAQTGRTRIPVIDPSSGATITTIANASVEDAIAAVDAAAKAAPDWAAFSPRRRADILMRAFAMMTDRSEWLAKLISLENGKALSDARGEVAYAAEFFRWYAEEAVRMNGEISVAPSGNNHIVVQYQPIGVAVLITPWNFPAAMATRKIGPALAAGCTCILKPATETPLTALAIAQILDDAGVPAGVVNVVTTSTSGKVVGAMLHDPRVRKLSFTGSTEVGRVLLREAADQVLSCSMELGGNAPFLVLEDADIDEAVDGAMVAKMRNGGQACTAANRFYVHQNVAAEFTEKLVKRMCALKTGIGYADDTDLGPLINEAARKKIVHLVDEAVARGAKVVCGGHGPEETGCFYPPTVLTQVAADAEILRDEIFGPVAPIVSFNTEEEAIALANQTEYGLAAYVFTKDLARGLQLSARLESGMVALNRGLVSEPAAPFGGVKQSGLGREGGHHGLLEYAEAKYIATSW